ncbi:hypothetical protein AGABI2DRAFT_192280 [Agaricus bisporus var. bisporus H97]|uniref:hypothetical protein n=1 Tax=Agaricus bisporus var. bisporus (strain H97 / ATCC MYA-4626 / FGSC 10389) TaxID=936046 RepID=UPI00029F5D27|nr:hypothetical protein AGABI2DRAFT_192280 [Agaricus bisporus var. bisporus H97]EKV46998.1 hypothetical protein AGABI2DRAFT_192280 [Agaricus bisporus var. bisporus H97]
MKKCRQEEKSTRRHHRLKEARNFASKAQQHERHMRILNDRASEVIFAENNKDLTLRKIDLHGLRVKEAIQHTDRALKQARERGNSEMRIIVGKGLHSKDGNPKIKPAIQAFLEKHHFPVEVDPRNIGALNVRLDFAFSS